MKYFFRAMCILDYNEETKTLTYPLDDDGTETRNYDNCKFIKEDYGLLARFYKTIQRHKAGHDVIFNDVEVY